MGKASDTVKAEGSPARRVGSSLAPVRVAAPSAKGFTGFQEALRWLNERVNIERSRPESIKPEVFKLDRMRALLDAMGNPESKVRMVHVAGSKGKGSVVEMTSSCLQACGYTVGVYTSPHLVHVRERIRLGRDPIPHGAFTDLAGRVALAGASIEAENGPATYFEVLTAMGLAYFADQAVDVAVIETGLGGRLDSTNVITPEVTAITAIQLEHTQILGDTLAKIAREKAGIFKPGVPALTVPQKPEVIDVFREVASAVGAPLRVLGKDVEYSCRFEASPEHGPHARVCVTTPTTSYEHLVVPLKGEHQAPNCGLALAILDALKAKGFVAPETQVAQGLAATPTHGRMDLVKRSPRIIVDGAHTPDSIQALMKALGAHLRYDSLVVVFGCASDKDVDGMLAKLALGADKVIFTKAAGNARAAEPRELQRRFVEQSGKMTQATADLATALDLASRAVGRGDLVCVTGSFYLAGEARKLLTDAASPRRTIGRRETTK